MTSSATGAGEPSAVEPAAPVTAPPATKPEATTEPVITEPVVTEPAAVQQHVIRRTRAGGVWIASAAFAVVLLLLLIFILANGNKVEISYFGAHGHLPLGVALLLSAVLGVLLVVIPGTARIVQLRLVARRHRKLDSPLDSR
jgi:lipopolysaccharide assembly protein A